jgi:hypothetical protein
VLSLLPRARLRLVCSQELSAESAPLLLTATTLERALVCRLEAPPGEARDTPFQYLLGCVHRGVQRATCGVAQARQRATCDTSLLLCRAARSCYRRASDEARRITPRDGDAGVALTAALSSAKELVRRALCAARTKRERALTLVIRGRAPSVRRRSTTRRCC